MGNYVPIPYISIIATLVAFGAVLQTDGHPYDPHSEIAQAVYNGTAIIAVCIALLCWRSWWSDNRTRRWRDLQSARAEDGTCSCPCAGPTE